MYYLIVLVLALPNATLTPGAVRGLTKTQVCSIKWGRDARHVTEKMKVEVAHEYGLMRSSVVNYTLGPCCEVDHLIPRELGGADDVRNLWPQLWLDARHKDILERRLHWLVCTGSLTLLDAQRMIAADWVSAYTRYAEVREDVR